MRNRNRLGAVHTSSTRIQLIHHELLVLQICHPEPLFAEQARDAILDQIVVVYE